MGYVLLDEDRYQIGYSQIHNQWGEDGKEVDCSSPSDCYTLKTDWKSFSGTSQWVENCTKSKNKCIDYQVKCWEEFKLAINEQILNAQIDGDTTLEASLKVDKATEKTASEARIQAILDEEEE